MTHEALIERLKAYSTVPGREQMDAEIEVCKRAGLCPPIEPYSVPVAVSGRDFPKSDMLDPITGPGIWMALAKERGWRIAAGSWTGGAWRCQLLRAARAGILPEPLEFEADHDNPAIACAIAFLSALGDSHV